MSDLLEYKCPCCGGAIEFDSTLQKMKCPFCDTEIDMETVKEFNKASAEQPSDDMSWENASNTAWKDEETNGMSVLCCCECRKHTSRTSTDYVHFFHFSSPILS